MLKNYLGIWDQDQSWIMVKKIPNHIIRGSFPFFALPSYIVEFLPDYNFSSFFQINDLEIIGNSFTFSVFA